MDSKYDNIKKLMSEDNAPLPPELNWEHMEEGILQKMDELQTDQAFPAKRNWLIKPGRILAILSIALLFLPIFICTNKHENQADLESQLTVDDSELPEQRSENMLNPKSSSISEDSGLTQSDAADSPEDSVESTLSLDQNQDSSHLVRSKSLSRNTRSNLNSPNTTMEEEDTSNHAQPLETLADLKQKTLITVEPNKQSTSINQLGNPNSVDQKSAYLYNPISLLPTKQFVVEKESEPETLPTILREVAEQNMEQGLTKVPANRISFSGGLSWWSEGYGDTKPERYLQEQTLTSYNAQVNYIHTFKKNYALLIGIQLQQLESRFDWSTDLDDFTITLMDTIVQVQVNLLTGEQSVVRGDVEVNVPATRTVQHYNQTRLYQIPVAIGKTWVVQNWQADLFIGGALNIRSENKGRTLYQGELLDYNAATTEVIENQWNIHGLFMGRLTYQINNSFGIMTGVQLQKSLTNWSTEPDINMHPNILSWEFGVNYQFF